MAVMVPKSSLLGPTASFPKSLRGRALEHSLSWVCRSGLSLYSIDSALACSSGRGFRFLGLTYVAFVPVYLSSSQSGSSATGNGISGSFNPEACLIPMLKGSSTLVAGLCLAVLLCLSCLRKCL